MLELIQGYGGSNRGVSCQRSQGSRGHLLHQNEKRGRIRMVLSGSRFERPAIALSASSLVERVQFLTSWMVEVLLDPW